jgi:hypothetical protein
MAVVQPASAIGSFLGRFIDNHGDYDATRFADELRWRQEDIAAFLDKTPGAVSKNPRAATSQDELARLAKLVEHAYALNGNNMALTLAWLRAPIRALDNRAPKQLITERKIGLVEELLVEMETGLSL